MISIENRLSRPVSGPNGAVSAGHPLAVSAGLVALAAGGNALDAAIAAQAVVCAIMPQAAGLGGDMLALVSSAGEVTAVGGTGLSPSDANTRFTTDGGGSITVPGLVAAWVDSHARWGSIPLATSLAPAIGLARNGYRIDADLARAANEQRERISKNGAAHWSLLQKGEGDTWHQPELAALLEDVAQHGIAAFYTGQAADAITAAVNSHGGSLNGSDLAAHRTQFAAPVSTAWNGGQLRVQPPSTQGTLLAMAAKWLEQHVTDPGDVLDHVMIEATEAAFQFRDDVATDGKLLDRELEVDRERAAHRGGPRAYLHTAGIATVDSSGMIVSSLISVFDDFGSGVYVPELGICLNNRAAGFTSGANAAAPSKRPVHTLAPALYTNATGDTLAIATPGADGQVQTLIQILARMRYLSIPLGEAIAARRWRSENGELLLEDGHRAAADLRARGHRIAGRPAGDNIFGGVVAAGTDRGLPFAAADWRRNVAAGAL